MATQIFSSDNAPEDSYRWSFVYADGELERILGNNDIFLASTPKPKKDGYYELLVVDSNGIIHECVAKLTDDEGHIAGLVTVLGERSYHYTT